MIVTPELQPRWNAVILDVLRFFTELCRKHGLTYYCCGGTAIGAIRHEGFIPWDDDIDVFMPRPHYDRFIQIASTADLGCYELVTAYNKADYPLFFAKLCNKNTTLIEKADTPCVVGLHIDIFPIDGAPDDVAAAQAMEARFRKTKNKLEAICTHSTFGEYLRLLTMPKEWGRFVRKTVGFFFRRAYREHLLRQLADISYQYDYDSSTIVAVYCGSYGPKEVFPKEWLRGTVPFPFEGLSVDLPTGYDQYLRQYYGDYMQLPPEEKRIAHHRKAYFNLDRRVPDDEAIRMAQKERN